MKIEEAIKQRKFESNFHKAMINIMYTHNWLTSKSAELFKEFDIQPQHFNVLRILKGRYPGSACPGEIKEVMLDKNPDLTRLIDKLVLRGLVERKLSDENRRKVNIKITKYGLSFLEEIMPRMKESQNEIANKLTDKEAQTLSDLLDKIRE